MCALEVQLDTVVAAHSVDENCYLFFLQPNCWEELMFWRLFSPHVMRTVRQLSHFSGMNVNVIWFPLAQDLGFLVWTNEPSIIFPPDWKKINFSWFVVPFLIADVCSMSVQILVLQRGFLGGRPGCPDSHLQRQAQWWMPVLCELDLTLTVG